MKVSRRRFIVSLVGAATVAVALPYSLWRVSKGRSTDIVVSILKRRLGYLKIDAEDFELYAKEYVKFRKQYDQQLVYLSLLATPMQYISPYDLLALDHPIRRLEDNVISNFLMSTDFFQHDADENRKINYRFFYDPFVYPCQNPFYRPV